MDAYEVDQYLQSAAGEVGYAAVDAIKNNYAEPAMIKSYKAFVDFGGDPRFFGEVYADQVYDDVDFQVDLIGDQIYGLENRDEILDELERNYAKAVAILRTR